MWARRGLLPVIFSAIGPRRDHEEGSGGLGERLKGTETCLSLLKDDSVHSNN